MNLMFYLAQKILFEFVLRKAFSGVYFWSPHSAPCQMGHTKSAV